jgi:hypothetical protein
VLKADTTTNPSATSTILLDTFQVDATGLQLVGMTSQQYQLDGALVSVTATQHGFYLYVNQNQGSSTPSAEVEGILFDPTSGQASIVQPLMNVGIWAQRMMMDTLGRNLVLVAGQNCESLWFTTFSPADGSITLETSASMDCGVLFSPVAFDPTGRFLYARFGDATMHIFDTSTGTEIASSPLPGSLEPEIGGQADPQGPYAYQPGPPPGLGVSVYGIDSTTGYPVLPTAFSTPLFSGRELLVGPATVNVNGQPVQVPAVGLSATSLDFGSITMGQSSSLQTVTVTDTGGRALSLSSIQLSGPNAADFVESDTCMASPQIGPGKSCAISIRYSPAAVGSSSAAVLITDDAAGSPQQIALTGAAVAPPNPTPGVTLNPNPFNIAGTITEGTSSATQNVVLTNSGNAALHVQSVVLGGTNAGDFNVIANGCIGTLAANANCVISVVFTPSGPSVRAATLTFSDDAPGSPQVLNVYGTGGFAANFNGTTTAQFNLQVTAGAGFSGTVSFTCTGVPFVAACTVPGSLSISNGATTPFEVTVSTTAGGSMPVLAPPSLPGLRPPVRLLIEVGVAVAIAFWLSRRRERWRPAGMPVFGALAVVLAAAVTLEVGCGGGSSPAPQTAPAPPSSPQAAATPSMQPAGGIISTGFPTVTISDGTAGATIYYTTDGSTPTTSSRTYSSGFTLNAPTTVQAMAAATGYANSAVAVATYKFQTPSGSTTIVVTPTAVPSGSSKQLQLNPINLTLTVK